MATSRLVTIKQCIGLCSLFFGLSMAITLPAQAEVTVTYTYDELDRLQTVVRSDAPEVAYAHDVVGNITSETITQSPDFDGDLQADFADLDDDNDGMTDLFENQYGLNPLDPNDAVLDPDNDGRDNLQEFLDGTNPLIEDAPNVEEVNIPVLPLWALALLGLSLLSVFKLRRQAHRLVSFALVGVALSFIAADPAQAALEPNWHSSGAKIVSPEDAQAILGIDPTEGSIDENFIMVQSNKAVPRSIVYAATEFTQLAEALENDPLKIYLFVKNNIDYIPYFGALKGAQLTYIERAGNDFDQAALLVELLRAAGYTANYRIGTMYIPINAANNYDAANWLGVTPSSLVITQVLANGGVPVGTSGSNITATRAWVEVIVGSTLHRLDPAFKRYAETSGIDLAAAMNYSQSGLLSAVAGATGTNYVQNLNEAGLGNELLRLSNDLTAYIKANHPNATTDQIVSGREIIPETPTTLPTSVGFATISNLYSSIPVAYIHTLQIQQGGLDTTLNIRDIAGKKLSLVYADTPSSSPLLLASSSVSVIEQGNSDIVVSEPSSAAIVIDTLAVMPPSGVEFSEDGQFVLGNISVTNAEGELLPSLNSAQNTGVAALAAGTPVNWGAIQQTSLPANWAFVSPVVNNTSWTLKRVGTVTGNSAYQMTQGYNSVTLPGWTYSMNMRINPTSRGTKTGTLNIVTTCLDVNCGSTTATFNMTAHIAEVPNLAGSGRSFSAQLGSPLNSTVYIQNFGSVAMSVTSVALLNNGSGQFQLTSGTGTGSVSSGAQRTIGVRYLASSRGSHSATVRITYNYDGINGYTVNLPVSGITGAVADLGGSSGANFGQTQLGVTVDRDVVLNNNGSYPLTITNTQLVGTHSSRFQLISGTGNATLATGNERRTSVRYRADVIGSHSASVRVTFNYDGRTGLQIDLPLSGETSDVKYAQLYLDDVLIAEESTTPTDPDAITELHVNVGHPYASNGGEFADQDATYHIKRTGTYVLVSGFGTDQRSELLTRVQRELDTLRASGLADTSNEVLTASLNVMGQTWMQQTALNANLLAEMANVLPIQHHRFGLVGQETGYFIDVKNQVISVMGRNGDDGTDYFRARSFMASALEHGVLEQLQQGQRAAASTIKVLKLANQQGERIYNADNSNWASIRPLLSNYTTGDLDGFEDAITNDNARLILPANGAITLNQWSGKGYVDYRANATELRDSLGMIIGGGYFGGYGGSQSPLNIDLLAGESYLEWQPVTNIKTPKAADPVDLGSGAFITEMTDMALGGSGSRGLAFTRFYNSQQSSQNAVGLGRGWTHNYNMGIRYHSDVESAMGQRAPLDSVAIIVANHVALGLMANVQPTLSEWTAAALTADWAMEELLNNAVTITLGTEVMTFIQFPNGTYCPPEGVTITLQGNAGNFQALERFGTAYTFNSNDKIASVIDIDGNSLTFTYSGEKLVQVKDTFNRRLSFGYAGGGVNLTQVTDSTGRVVTYSYTGEDLTSVTGLESAQWQYAYDGLDQILTVTDPVGTVVVDNTYDALGRVTQQIAPRQSGSAIYKMHYTGLSASEEAPDGSRVTYYYNDDKRTVAIEDTQGNRTKNQYDGQGHVAMRVDPRGNQTEQQFDGNNNLLKAIDANNDESDFEYDTQHRLIRSTNALNHSSETDYDAEHHPTRRRDALNNEVATTYRTDGLPNTITNARNVVTIPTYDSLGQLDTQQTGSQPVVDSDYNTRGWLTSLTDQAGAQTQFAHDERGLVTTRTDALGKTTTYVYNDLGLLTNQTDRNGDASSISYTPTSKIDTLTYPTRPGTTTHFEIPGFAVNFSYDNKDRLTTMVDQHGSTTNSYDALDRLIGHTDPNGYTVQYVYDEASNITQLTYPNGKTVSYQYDNLNRVSNVSIDWLNKSAQPSFDAAGRLMGVTHFNDTSTTYQFDNANRLTGLTHYKGNNTAFADYQYTLDANGNRTQAIITNEPIKPAGLINGVSSKTYNTQKNRITGAVTHEPITIDYDDKGQIEIMQGDTTSSGYGFDAAGRVTYYGTADQYATYQYDGAGNRISATRSDPEDAGIQTTRHYVHDASGNLLAVLNEQGQVQKYFIYGLGLMAMVDATTNQVYTYHFDGTGHTVAMTNNNQQITHRYAYSPYGLMMAKEETVNQPFTYAGQVGIFTEYDGVYYMRARYYDAKLRQFISVDPAGFSGGINLYAYVGGNPLGYVDPTGLRVFGISIGGSYSFRGVTYGRSYTVAVDSNLDFGIVRTDEGGIATSGGNAFLRGLYGGGDHMVDSLRGQGVSVSGQLGLLSGSVSSAVSLGEADKNGFRGLNPFEFSEPIYELGIGIGGSGISATNTIGK